MTQKKHFLPFIDSATSPSSSSHTSSKSSSLADAGSTSDAVSSPTRSKRGILGIRPNGVHGACAETVPAPGAKRVVYVRLARLHYDCSFHRTGFDTQSASGAHIFSYPRQFKHLLFSLYMFIAYILYHHKTPFHKFPEYADKHPEKKLLPKAVRVRRPLANKLRQ